MSEKKPGALRGVAARSLCPVCGKASYSLNGTHPQCALARFDADDRAERKATAEVAVKPERKAWLKSCPKCGQQIPARRAICDCGHSFLSAAFDSAPRESSESPSQQSKPR
jgi:predicted RNA-binding Zn-ribbon protein involved in translation (DUF1610 family)